jgi:UDP-N-acetylmuramoyl-tripeptide--D-alanyl-D-alanine ligase
MAVLTTEDIVQATGGELLSDNSIYFGGVSIDSRTISDGEIFFAIRGKNYDGHDFLESALSKGGGAVIDSKQVALTKDKVIIYVRDTVKALQDLAHALRMRQDIPVIAITGSNGKTTTKEMTYSILSERYRVLKNRGNLNNHIGLPLSLSGLSPDIEVVVLELGMNAAGEVKRLCEIAAPSHGIITNIGLAHIGELGSLEAVRDAKLEILEGLSVTVLNADDSFLM